MDTSKLKFKAEIMDENAMKRALRRIAHEIIENNGGVENLKLVGIQRRGVTLAKMIREMIEQVEGVKLPLGVLDITFYRDDLSILSEHPVVNATDLPFQVQDARIVMVDDVLFSGRTARAAMDAICDMGRPSCVQLAVMVARKPTRATLAMMMLAPLYLSGRGGMKRFLVTASAEVILAVTPLSSSPDSTRRRTRLASLFRQREQTG